MQLRGLFRQKNNNNRFDCYNGKENKIYIKDTDVLLDLLCMSPLQRLKTEIVTRLSRGMNWGELFDSIHTKPAPLPPKLAHEFMLRLKYCTDNCTSYCKDEMHFSKLQNNDVLAKLSYQHHIINKEPSFSLLTLEKLRTVRHILLHFRDFLDKYPDFVDKPIISPEIRKKWIILMLSVASVRAFESVVVKNIGTDDIENEIEQYNRKGTGRYFFEACYSDESGNFFTHALEKYQTESSFLDLCTRGSPTDIEEMKTLLGRDPARVYPSDDPRKLVNCVNEHNETATYIACKTGNYNLVSTLLKYSPDIYIGAEYIDNLKTLYETPLECSCRWGYTKIVALLMEYCEPKIADDACQFMFKKAINKTKDSRIKSMISPKLLKK